MDRNVSNGKNSTQTKVMFKTYRHMNSAIINPNMGIKI